MAVHVVQDMEKGLGLKVNAAKSAVLGTTKGIRAQLRRTANGRVRSTDDPVKDLGVVQSEGMAARHLARQRWRTAVDRLRRIGQLPLALPQRVLLVQSTALAAGAYGAAGSAIPNKLLQGLQRWIMFALHRGTRRAAAELLLWHGWAAIQTSARFNVLLRTLKVVRLLAKDGAFDTQELRELYSGAAPDGPLRAMYVLCSHLHIRGALDQWQHAGIGTAVLPLT